jgi:mRNA-degrading endonuclease RelE of RelBE toxin-antitoxin system
MRRIESITGGYSVEVRSSAWKQLSHLPRETYQLLREELEAVASRLAGSAPTPPPVHRVSPVSSRSLELGDYIVFYDVDPERRLLVLTSLSRRG